MSAPSTQIVALTALELDTLHGAGPLAFQTYVLLRTWMDYQVGIVGRTRPISLAMLRTYCETHTPRGAGTQTQPPSEKAVRTALDRLTRTGLLRRLHGERLAFSLPKALIASARPEQTRQGVGTLQSTEPGGTVPAPVQGFMAEPGTPAAPSNGANRAHIMNHVFLSSTCALVDYLEQQNVPTIGKEETIERWRADGLTLPALQQAVGTAHALRAKAGSSQPLNVGFLDSLLTNAHRTRYRRTGGGLIETGTAQGKPPRPGESWDAYRRRLAIQPSPCEPKGRGERAPC
jgi:hypothetical protein